MLEKNTSGIPREASLYSQMLNRILGRESRRVFRGMAVLATGSAVAQAVGMLSMPILTRLYTPDDFGLMAIFTAFVLIITPILTLRYVLAIPQPRRDGTAMNLMVLSILLILIFGTGMGLLLWAFGPPLLRLMGMEELAPWWWLIIMSCLGGAFYEALSYWATRRRAYKVIARTSIMQQIWSNFIKIGLGALSFGPVGLLIGQMISKSAGTITLGRAFWKEFRRSWRQVRYSRVRVMASRYVSFPIYRVPSQFLLTFAQQFPLMGLAYLYGPKVAGSFSLAWTSLSLPLGLIGTSMGRALFAEASSFSLVNRDRIYVMAKEVQIRLLVVSIIPAFVLYMVGPTLFSLVFGSAWRQSGEFASILAIVILFQFTSSPVMQLLNIFANQSTFLTINIVRTAAVLGVFFWAEHFSKEAETLLLAYAVIMTGFYILVSFTVMFKIKHRLSR